MTPPINSVSPERLDELAQWAASEEAECLQDDMPVSAGYYADIIKLIAARRAANTPVDPEALGYDQISQLSPALPSQVGVKPLPWKENGASSIWTGELQFGVYYTIYVESAGWRVFRHQFLSETSETEIAFVSSLASAKAAAQANFDQAIQSCLTSPAAVPVGIVVAEDDDLSVYWYEGFAVSEGDELYTHPAPSASREVTVTDEMVERACRAAHPAWDEAVTDSDKEWRRKQMRAALLAALPEREG